jgi:exopolyphosphatase/guanosine-5'-triphosphate,3'-diphosphate pyrophosphatase
METNLRKIGAVDIGVNLDEDTFKYQHFIEQDLALNKGTNLLYMDVGAMETKLIVYANGKKVSSQSFKIGDMKLLSETVSIRDMEIYKDWLDNITELYSPSAIIASGERIDIISDILGSKESGKIDYFSIKELYEKMQNLTIKERMDLYNIEKHHSKVILATLYLYLIAFQRCKILGFYSKKQFS